MAPTKVQNYIPQHFHILACNAIPYVQDKK